VNRGNLRKRRRREGKRHGGRFLELEVSGFIAFSQLLRGEIV